MGVNVTEIYPEGRPSLKGLFNTLETWRGWRDLDGWRLQKVMDSAGELASRGASRAETQATYPAFIRITDEMMMHVKGMLTLFHTDMPLTVPI